MRRGPKDQPGEVQRLLLGLGLQLRATHAGGRAALIDAYGPAENGRGGAEIRARLFGRHGRPEQARANGLSLCLIKGYEAPCA